MLGNIPGSDIFRNLDHYKDAVRVPGFLILSIEAPINFVNTTYLKERLVNNLPFDRLKKYKHNLDWNLIYIYTLFCFSITRWIQECEAEEKETTKIPPGLRYVILDLSGEYVVSSKLK